MKLEDLYDLSYRMPDSIEAIDKNDKIHVIKKGVTYGARDLATDGEILLYTIASSEYVTKYDDDKFKTLEDNNFHQVRRPLPFTIEELLDYTFLDEDVEKTIKEIFDLKPNQIPEITEKHYYGEIEKPYYYFDFPE